jgi:ATP-dependent DNA helicase RecG
VSGTICHPKNEKNALRPIALQLLFASLNALKGLGPKMAPLVERVAGPLVRDLVYTPPASIIHRHARQQIADCADGSVITTTITIEQHLAPAQPRKPYRIRARAGDAFLTLVWFHGRAAQLEKLAPVGEQRVVSGKVERFGGEIQMPHPDYVLPLSRVKEIPALEPVYPLTQGLSNKMMRKYVAAALTALPTLKEWIDPNLLGQHEWPAWHDAMWALHFAGSKPLKGARERLAYDEIFADQLTLAIARLRARKRKGAALPASRSALVRRVIDTAPFTPTNAQLRATKEIIADLEAPERMSRLLQGDVGAGKTFVAALASARIADAGLQSAVMAPTEVLARQHARSLHALLAPAGLRVAALTGRDKGKKREEILAQLADGEIDVICGTQALFQEGVHFKALRLVVVDEQHRFGVQDRLRLMSKAEQPDLLVMTATPIPRTLTLARYGDMDVSKLDEKPAGRQPITTSVMPEERLGDIVAGIDRALARGEQVYWVCPLVEDSELLDLTSAEERATTLENLLPSARIGLVHGRIKAEEKDALLSRFRAGEINLLVATTVIEVGVDAPDATIMVIENAERFGLSQLHQLRGRVGRGDKASSCVLVYKAPLGETAKQRLATIRESEDGFYLAEEDWRLRGAGDVLGNRQTGDVSYRIADLERDFELLNMASQDARLLLQRDETLSTPRGQAARALLYLLSRDHAITLLKVG